MPIGDLPGAAPGATYNGFSGPPLRATPAEKRRRTIALAGVVAALGLGLIAGAVVKPKLAVGHESREMEAVRQVPTGPQLAIVVDPEKPPPKAPPVAKAERLEVLPAELARAAPRPPVVETAWREDEGLDDRPIDCGAPANRHEARICRDIGFSDEAAPAPLDIPPPEEDRWFR